jgi:hypothetical protein
MASGSIYCAALIGKLYVMSHWSRRQVCVVGGHRELKTGHYCLLTEWQNQEESTEASIPLHLYAYPFW